MVKMFLNPVMLIALAGAVKTSVIVNVYEDGEYKASHSLRGGCNFRACDQLCRRLGFKGGVCVGDRCKCDILTPLIVSKDPVRSRCNYRGCDQICRGLGFTGGACVGDRCKCNDFASMTENDAENSLRGGCNYRACDQLCRRLGFTGGVCIGDRCKCDNFEPIKVKGEALNYLLSSAGETKQSHHLGYCNSLACYRQCRHLGSLGGACAADKCVCVKSKEEKGSEYLIEEEETDDSNSEEGNNHFIKDQSEAVTVTGGCNVVHCNNICRRLDYIGGLCREGSCECY